MSKRTEHTFQFTAAQIATAARERADYHEARRGYWLAEHEAAAERVLETASVTIKELPQTGGTRREAVVDFGDVDAHARLGQSWQRAEWHRQQAELFESDWRVYSSQDPHRAYELDPDDVHFFGLGGTEANDGR